MERKVVLIGSSNVGKSCLFDRIQKGNYNPNIKPTLGGEVTRIEFVDKGEIHHYSFWDTAGSEKFQSLAPMYFRESVCVVIVFSYDSVLSMNELGKWVNRVNEDCGSNPKIIVVANKSDLHDKAISDEEAENAARRFTDVFFSVSALNGNNIDLLKKRIQEYIVIAKKQSPAEIDLNINYEKKNSCC